MVNHFSGGIQEKVQERHQSEQEGGEEAAHSMREGQENLVLQLPGQHRDRLSLRRHRLLHVPHPGTL
uniref:Uncharacterized protein n=2 Tax=Anguilla anguilla TaxID=7936 RepID=A0A0E9QEM1_ANGAN